MTSARLTVSSTARSAPFLVTLAASLLLLCSAAAFAQQQPRTIDRVAAIVDEGVILESEVAERMSNVMQQFQGQGLPRGLTEADVRAQVLDQLVIETIQMQLATRSGVRIDDNTLNQTMADIAQRNGMDFESFRQVLEAENAYMQTRRQIEREMVIGQFQNRAVNSRIDITRQEVENYLRSEEGVSTISPEYRVAHILIPGDDTLTEDSRRYELALELKRRIEEEGANIIELAQSGRQAGFRLSGGELGWNKPEALPTLFAPFVPDMQPGDVREPFISPSGVHLVQLLETRGGAELRIQQAHVRHILIAPNQIRTEEQAERLVHELYQRILDGEDFGAIARQNTDDVSSIVSGGDLDWVSQQQLPSDFAAAIQDLEINEISEPFRSETGWHIAEVMERRVRDVSDENKRFRAENILRDRKFDMALENWLTELRDTTYIKILSRDE